MTTDPYAEAAASTFGRDDQAPSDYRAGEPFAAPVTPTGTDGTTHGSSTDASSTNRSSTNPSSTKDTAADEAGQVKDTAVDAAQQVAGTAKQEAGNVVGEAKAQASDLVDQVKGEAGSQVATQQQRLAGIVGSYAKELGSMASGSEESGPLTDLTRQASDKAGEAAHWLENHKPAELLDEVRSFARRRPGAFLLGAAVAGIVVGRLTRGAIAEAKSDDPAPTASRPAPTETVPSGTSSLGSDPDAVVYGAADGDAGYTVPPAHGLLDDRTAGDVIR